MAKSSQDKIEYNKQYNRDNGYVNQKRYYESHPSKTITIRIFEHTEGDIIEHLENMPNRSGYIKDLIRADMLKNGK